MKVDGKDLPKRHFEKMIESGPSCCISGTYNKHHFYSLGGHLSQIIPKSWKIKTLGIV
jgi:hypothetical protein